MTRAFVSGLTLLAVPAGAPAATPHPVVPPATSPTKAAARIDPEIARSRR